MLIIEKIFHLKTVDLFSEISEDKLIALAEIMEEEYVPKGGVIFNKGDNGHVLYIIESGMVLIHDNDKALSVLKGGDFFGEISLLSSETRSANATAKEDTVLLKLDQWQFYELLEVNTSIIQSVIKTLCARLIKQNELLTKLSSSKD